MATYYDQDTYDQDTYDQGTNKPSLHDFFATLYADVPYDLYTALQGFNGTKKPAFIASYTVDSIDEMVACIDAHRGDPGVNIYFRVAPLKERPSVGKRGGEKETAGSGWLWGDYDTYNTGKTIEETLDALERFMHGPTFAIFTGRGIQAGFKLSEFCTDLQLIKGANKWIENEFKEYGADSVQDLARVLRVPTTYNHKTNPPGEASILVWRPDRVYQIGDFDWAPVDETVYEEPIEAEELTEGFLQDIRKMGKMGELLYKRILSEETARESNARLIDGGDRVDRSVNDWFIIQTLLEWGYSEGQVASVLMHPVWFSGARFRQRRSYDYVNRTIQKAAARAKATSLCKYDASDEGNAQAAYELYGTGVHYSSEARGKWITHDGTHWEDEGEAKVMEYVLDTLRQRRTQASGDKEILKAAKGMAAKVSSCMLLLKAQPKVSIHLTAFDMDKDLLPTRSGMVDLRTSEVMGHSPSFLNTSCINSEIGTAEDATPFLDHLYREIYKSEEVVPFIKRFAGYSATGHTTEDKMIHLLAKTRSGKGTTVQPLLHLFGNPLGGSRLITTFTERRNGDTQNFDLAPLRACRMLVVSEGKRNEPLDASKVKTLLGHDLIDCEYKFGQRFQYLPQFKIWLSSNFDINADVADDALWGKILVVKFLHSYLGREDPSIREMMFSERVQRGILWWVIEGAREWYQDGLNPPECTITGATEQRSRGDYIMHWIEDCCKTNTKDPTDERLWSPTWKIMRSYTSWCSAEGVAPMLQKNALLSLTVKGHLYSDETRRYAEDIKGETKRLRGVQGIEVVGSVGRLLTYPEQ